MKLFGFRSDSIFKKFLAFIYYFLVVLFLGFALFSDPGFNTSIYDLFLYKISLVLIALAFLVSPLLLSNFKIKGKTYKLKSKPVRVAVFVITFFFFFGGSFLVNLGHSDDYNVKFQQHFNDFKEELGSFAINFFDKVGLSDAFSAFSFDDSLEQSDTPVATGALLKVNYIDVGQGDSIFIEMPDETTMLIDAGESYEATTVIDYINSLGYTKIDYVVATHPHSDHIGGMQEVIENFEVGNIYMPKAASTSKTYENLLDTIADRGLTIKTAKAGLKIIDKDQLLVEVLSPTKDTYSDLNNYSVVLKITYGANSFLFMGDAEKEVEEELVLDETIDVIKIGHHGSDTSSSEAFVEQVKSQVAIISVGEDNKYDHPVLEIVERWEEVGALIFETKDDGTIIAKSDGKNLEVTATASSKKYTSSGLTSDLLNDESSSNNSLEESLELISLNTSIKAGDPVNITVKGSPTTLYDISVIYSSGPSSSKDLYAKESDADGNVSWSFKVGNNTKPGNYEIIISSESQKATYQFTVVE